MCLCDCVDLCDCVCERVSHQEGAEEDEGDKVTVGKLSATAPLVVWRHGEGGQGGVWLALLPPQTRQHDLLPRLPCRTPVNYTANQSIN